MRSNEGQMEILSQKIWNDIYLNEIIKPAIWFANHFNEIIYVGQIFHIKLLYIFQFIWHIEYEGYILIKVV